MRAKRLCREATFESGAIQFDPSLLHATAEWTGTRVVIIGFTVRDLAKLGLEDKSYLETLLGKGYVMDTAEQQIVARSPKRVQAEDPFHGYMLAARTANYGDALTVSWRGLHQSMCDGCGLNSPGRWRPGSRGLGLPSEAGSSAEIACSCPGLCGGEDLGRQERILPPFHGQDAGSTFRRF